MEIIQSTAMAANILLERFQKAVHRKVQPAIADLVPISHTEVIKSVLQPVISQKIRE